MISKISILLGLILMIFSCSPKIKPDEQSITYLALGDSYTIGEKVKVPERWPVQLTKELDKNGYKIVPPTIIAQTGWTTADLLAAMDEKLNREEYDLVSVLIGVNNQYQGKSIEVYKKELREILERAIDHSAQGKQGVFVLSIPDYGITPFGKAKAGNISEEIAQFNAACKNVCQSVGVDFYNITPISKYAEMDESLLAEDMLHPSGLMYTLWVSEILKEVGGKLD